MKPAAAPMTGPHGSVPPPTTGCCCIPNWFGTGAEILPPFPPSPRCGTAPRSSREPWTTFQAPGDSRRPRPRGPSTWPGSAGSMSSSPACMAPSIARSNGLRRDDQSGVETLVRFLEADVYCFRSGYVKADAIRFLTRADLNDETMERLRRVALTVVDDGDRREFRAYIRLGRRVDSAAFRNDLRTRLDSGSRRTARHADWMLVGLGDPPAPTVSLP